ncbi:hypothetical protein Hanom_Chr08g00737521 [Helianthus anomalus]
MLKEIDRQEKDKENKKELKESICIQSDPNYFTTHFWCRLDPAFFPVR